MAARGRNLTVEQQLQSALAAITGLTEQVTTLTNTVGNLANQVTAVTGNVTNTTTAVQLLSQQSGGTNAGPVPFAISPGQVEAATLIDMRSKRGTSLKDAGCRELPTKFYLSPKHKVLFETELTRRAAEIGWDNAAQGIIKWTNGDGTAIYLISQYGQIDAATLKTACEIFLTVMKSAERMAQNNAMASKSILATLTDDSNIKLLAYRNDYEVTPAGANSSVVAFPRLYKTITRLATLDTSATSATLRNNIMKVAEYAKKVIGDVDQINAFVDLNYTQLKARGDTVPNASTAIMKAYIASPDVKFSEYFSKKLDEYWDETPEMHNISVEALLKKAKSKFDLIKSQDEWGGPISRSPRHHCFEVQGG